MTLKEKLLSLEIVEDNEYLDKYVELIESNRETKREKFKTQRHHIIPRCYFKINDIELDDSKVNLVNLLYKDHVLAHYYLSLCSTSIFKYNMIASMHHIIGNAKKNCDYNEFLNLTDFTDKLEFLQELYEYGRIVSSTLKRGKKRSQESIRKQFESRKGYKHSEETKKKIGDANRDSKNGMYGVHRQLNDETRQKLSCVRKRIGNSHTNKKYINNGIKCLCVSNNEIDDWLKIGYVLGRITSDEARKSFGKKVLCIDTNIVYDSLQEASNKTGASISKICCCCRGKRNKAGGYKWRYYNEA